MGNLSRLCAALDPARPVVVQAHDFPDHDAVGSAFALARLLERRGYSCRLCYGGTIQSESLRVAIDHLEIPISTCAELDTGEGAQIVVVDGFVGNSNMVGLPGRVVGVLDHHRPPAEPACPFFDIREEYGSCATIVFEYYHEAGVDPTKVESTALLIGLMMDTAFMTRGVSHKDLAAFSELFFAGEWEIAARLLRNSLSLADLATFREAILGCVVARDFCYVQLEGECSAEVAALVADFFLGLREIQFVAVVTNDRDQHRLSVRSEDPERPTDAIIRAALDGIGSGGGHTHMGGGTIPEDLYPGNEGLRKRFLAAFGWLDEEQDSE